jgi:hypothetical protein
MTDFWDVAPRRLSEVDKRFALMMESVHTSETSVYFNETTRRYIPKSCHLHTRGRKNFKSHMMNLRLSATLPMFKIQSFYSKVLHPVARAEPC